MSKIVPIMDSLLKPIVNEKKPRKVNKSNTQPQVHFVVDEIKSNTPPKKIKSLKLNAIDFTNKKLEKEISQIQKKINKLNIEISDNENIINNKKLETIDLKQQLDNLNEIKNDINVSVDI